MDAHQKQTALRMIPYGLYVLTGETEDGRASAAAVNWVTQTSFDPPLVAVGVKVDSGSHAVIKESGAFALNILGKEQGDVAVEFFKSTEKKGETIGGQPCRAGKTGAPIIESCPAYVECRLVDTLERGDHSIFVGEVVGAGVKEEPPGRPDEATLTLRDLGGDIFYGG
jgi:flavin reductase (DIM6/NTAB) family NADH-FMN oxidoreductase RutF